MEEIKVRIKRLADVPMPEAKTKGAAGFDLTAACDRVIPAKSFAIVPTGIACEMPQGVEAQVRPRSGLAALHGIGVLNSPGTIDSDYRGEIKVILFNLGERDFLVKRGQRIAQLVFARILNVEWEEVAVLSDTERGEGGFGHSGER